MKRQQLIKELKDSGNLRTLLKIMQYDQEQVISILKNGSVDVLPRVQGKAGALDEYINLITNALR